PPPPPPATGSPPKSTTKWSMHPVPAIRQRLPRTCTWAEPDAPRGTPSAYPTGTTPRVAAALVTWRWPYDTPVPAATRLTCTSLDRTVIAGRSQPGGPPGSVDRPKIPPPARTRSNQVSGSVQVAGVVAR